MCLFCVVKKVFIILYGIILYAGCGVNGGVSLQIISRTRCCYEISTTITGLHQKSMLIYSYEMVCCVLVLMVNQGFGNFINKKILHLRQKHNVAICSQFPSYTFLVGTFSFFLEYFNISACIFHFIKKYFIYCV